MEIPPVIGPPVIYGCTNPLATNYNPYATDDDGSCVFPGTGGPGTGGPGVGGPVTGGPVTGVRGPGQPSQPNVTSNAVVDASLTPSEQISELDESEPQQQRGYQISSFIAAPLWFLARSSSNLPSNMKAIITATDSKYTSASIPYD